MKVKLNTVYAGPKGCFQPGSIVDFSEAEAKELIKGRFAVAVTETATAPAPAVETATKEDPKSPL